jgi:hypothetical protein
MATARNLITGALRLIGVLMKSEAPSDDEAADALSALNGMLGTWSNESLLAFSKGLKSFPLTAGVSTYTIGTGATFNTSRPTVIKQAYIMYDGFDHPIDLISEEEYNEFSDKTQRSDYPNRLAYVRDYPNATIKLYPVPDRSSTLFLFMEQPLTEISSLDDEISLPPGWERALRYNLAIELAPEYDQMPSQLIMMTATTSKRALKVTTSREPETERKSWRYNIYDDTGR